MPQPAAQRPLTHYAIFSIAVAVVTLLLKVVAWRITGSVGLFSDALESLVNVAAAALALATLWVAARPADDEHSHGHTKVEYFASGMEGALILVAAAGVGWSAAVRFIHPQPLHEVPLGVMVTVVASLANLIAAVILLRVGKARHSVTLEAEGRHLMADVWTSAGVVIGVVLVVLTGWQRADPVLALLVAIQIVFTGVKLIHQSLLGLMDTALPADELEQIREILARYFVSDGVGYHALRTRQAAAWRFLTVHVLVPGNWTVARAHELVERLEEEIRLKLERINIVTHIEPLEDPSSWEDVELLRQGRKEHADRIADG